MIELSIIIPVSRTDDINICLESLKTQTLSHTSFEVILVGADVINNIQYHDSIQIRNIVTAITHPGYRRNLAVTQSRGKYLLFLDDDTCVKKDYLCSVFRLLRENDKAIISGTDRDERTGLMYELPAAIQASFFTEGLISHKKVMGGMIEVGRHDMPLSNLAMARDLFNKIGGFNEKATYFIDDVEFMYIAQHMGVRFLKFQELSIQHNVRPAFTPYFFYKFISRFRIGEILCIYPELYSDSFQIKGVLSSYLLFPLFFIPKLYILFFVGSAVYTCLLFFAAATVHARLLVKILLIPGIFIAHIFMYCGFSLGLAYGIIRYIIEKYLKKGSLFIHKKERYKLFSNKSE